MYMWPWSFGSVDVVLRRRVYKVLMLLVSDLV